jgi:hypothetical protein
MATEPLLLQEFRNFSAPLSLQVLDTEKEKEGPDGTPEKEKVRVAIIAYGSPDEAKHVVELLNGAEMAGCKLEAYLSESVQLSASTDTQASAAMPSDASSGAGAGMPGGGF